jgi:O-methyltransferase domain
LNAFFTYLQSQREDHPYWTDEGFYPVRERLVDGLRGDATADSSAIVDVGGGNGYALEDLRVRVPELKGRLILQDLPPVIEHVKMTGINPRIELMPHDFNNPQPVRGARVYFLRHILHDYNDEIARHVLAQLKQVMEPGYSKILLNECVVANQGAAWQHTSLDMFLMAMNTSQERSEKEWYDLIASAGLEIAGIWTQGVGSESLIEVVLPSSAAKGAAS